MSIWKFIILLFILNGNMVTLLAQDGRPNIVFILTDDQRSDALGYAGIPAP